jgi:hypothetical protein
MSPLRLSCSHGPTAFSRKPGWERVSRRKCTSHWEQVCCAILEAKKPASPAGTRISQTDAKTTRRRTGKAGALSGVRLLVAAITGLFSQGQASLRRRFPVLDTRTEHCRLPRPLAKKPLGQDWWGVVQIRGHKATRVRNKKHAPDRALARAAKWPFRWRTAAGIQSVRDPVTLSNAAA